MGVKSVTVKINENLEIEYKECEYCRAYVPSYAVRQNNCSKDVCLACYMSNYGSKVDLEEA